MQTRRRGFLKGIALAGVGLGTSTMGRSSAMEPVKRYPGTRMKTSIAGYSFREEFKADPPEMTLVGEFVDFAAEHGLDAIEPTAYYFPEPVTEEYLLELKRRSFLCGLDISGTAIGNSYTHPPGVERDAQIEMTKAWIDRAALLGAPSIRVFAGNIQKGGTEEEARKFCIETLQQCLAYAATKGVFLALENHGGIVSTAEQILAIVEQVDHPWFGVNLDTGNFHSEDPYREIERVAPYAVTVQLKVEMKPAGYKEKIPADFPRIVKILEQAGYRGYVAIEYEADADARTAIPEYIKELQKLV